jgi:hypothetical protein
LDKELARKIHETVKEQFMFFDNPEEMMGEFNQSPAEVEAMNRLKRYYGTGSETETQRGNTPS